MMHFPLLRNKTQLAIIDVQTKLVTTMPSADMQDVIQNCSQLLQVANLLDLPVVVTEQCRVSLGHTVPEIAQNFGAVKPIAKGAISACMEPRFKAKLQEHKPQVILAGLEAHTCIYQTAIGLVAQGKQVFVVKDAIISRKMAHKESAIRNLLTYNCIMIDTQSILRSWLGDASPEQVQKILTHTEAT